MLLELQKKRLTQEEIELKARISPQKARKIITKLQDNKMITFSKEGKVKIYFNLKDFNKPNFKRSSKRPYLEQIDGNIEKLQIKKEDLEKILKGVGAELVDFDVFYYPLWVAYLESKKVIVDGTTGKIYTDYIL